MVDWYFKRALLVDYFISAVVSGIAYCFYYRYNFAIPENEVLLSLTGDLSTISLTFAGFILTLLTILITFKTTAHIPTDENQHLIPLFDIFFYTPLYFTTITLLKNAIKSLIVIAMIGYVLKLVLHSTTIRYLIFFDIVSICVITLTLWRNLTILTLIMALQRNRNSND
ncbi:hypothetical protein GWR56_15795 [Mucilaginibacter sp. 14171R-50]|uniref:hypothetical protein n=1 Tax=Mucilaginibacter sp. 14171R-50 TaxID=2703789 RepID=UPI00138D6A09|nr:hypothetical protein [Mucilaginibacter sp. 14171R-50]QHS56937.1 hypothetical protein GWR56_15795 [Mucilaginibacter sp. 14171R-50]